MDKEAAHMELTPEEAQYLVKAGHRRRQHKVFVIAAGFLVMIVAFAAGISFGMTRDIHLVLPDVVRPVSTAAAAAAAGSSLERRASSPIVPRATSCPYTNLNTINKTKTTPTSTNTWWKPAAKLSWQIVLTPANGKPTPSLTYDYAAYDIDMFDNPASLITDLKNRGKKVICYFSAGSDEDWRPDHGCFTKSDVGADLAGWNGESWLNYKSSNVRNVMLARLDVAASKGCDAVDPDNVDAYDNSDNKLGLTRQDTINYVNFLCNAAHARNMSCGLKNSAAVVPSLVNSTEFQVNEECLSFGECASFKPYISKNKPVFNIEYPPEDVIDDPWTQADIDDRCADRNDPTNGAQSFSTVLKNHREVDEWIRTCPNPI